MGKPADDDSPEHVKAGEPARRALVYVRDAYGYSNAYLFANDGRLLLRLSNSFEIGPNLLEGPAKESELADLFRSIGEVANAPGWTTPLVAMASYSLIYKRGVDVFLSEARAAGFSGAVVPDLPAEEAEELAKLCRDVDFKLILLVSPTTAAHRLGTIVKACGGFVYVVSLVGITGERAAVSGDIRELLARLRAATDLPLCVGFGVSLPEHVKALRDIADGVIVGSALVKELDKATTPAEREKVLANVALKVGLLSEALRSP